MLITSTSSFGFDFKGVELGKTISPGIVTDKLGPECRLKEDKYSCYGDTTIAGYDAKVLVKMSKDQEVDVISVKFPSEGYEKIRNSLITKFGKPMEVDKTEIQNGMGAKFSQEKCYWKDQGSDMVLERFNRNINEGSLFMVSESYKKEATERLSKEQPDI